MNLAKAKLLVVRRHWFQQGQMAEYERIIKLLEDELQPATDENELENYIINSLIALINGENK